MLFYHITPNQNISITHIKPTFFGKHIKNSWVVKSLDQSFTLNLPDEKVEYSNELNTYINNKSTDLQNKLFHVMEQQRPWPNVIVKNSTIIHVSTL